MTDKAAQDIYNDLRDTVIAYEGNLGPTVALAIRFPHYPLEKVWLLRGFQLKGQLIIFSVSHRKNRAVIVQHIQQINFILDSEQVAGTIDINKRLAAVLAADEF